MLCGTGSRRSFLLHCDKGCRAKVWDLICHTITNWSNRDFWQNRESIEQGQKNIKSYMYQFVKFLICNLYHTIFFLFIVPLDCEWCICRTFDILCVLQRVYHVYASPASSRRQISAVNTSGSLPTVLFFGQLYRTSAYSANLNFQNRINDSLYPLFPR